MMDNKRTYEPLRVSVTQYRECDVIRTSNGIEQEEVGIFWKEKWSSTWES